MPSITYQNLCPQSDIGGNSHLLDLGDTRVILDAGTHPKLVGRPTMPRYDLIEEDSVDAIFVSHPHLDHMGSLPVLAKDQQAALVAMTEETFACGCALLHNSVNVMKAQRSELNVTEYPLYNHHHVEDLAKNWLTRSVGRSFSVGERDRVRCEFFPAGHVLGAVGIRLEQEDGRTVFYTGDVHFENQSVTAAAEFPEDTVDTLVIETTRGDTVRAEDYTREKEKQRLGQHVAKTLERGGTVLIPVFAFGKTQETLIMLRELMDEGAVPETTVHIGGLSAKMTSLADDFCDHPRRLHRGFRFLEDLPNLQVMRKGRSEPEFRPGEIYALSSGMMTEKTVSNRFARHIIRNPDNALLFVGYADPDSPAGRILATEPGDHVLLNGDSGEKFRLNCEVERFDFSGHATREQLADYAVKCRPRNVLLVHGDEPAKNWFKQELEQRLPDARVIIPRPGERIEL